MKAYVSLAVCAGLLVGCAEAPDKIQPTYVSPVQYSNMDCDQIRSEMYRVAGQVRVLTGQQARKHTNDAIALGVGLVIFWPALLFMIGGDKKDELAELKGEYDSLTAVATDKKCAVLDEMREQSTTQKNGAAPPTTPPSPVAPAAAQPATPVPGSISEGGPPSRTP